MTALPPPADADHAAMAEALELARQAIGLCDPNPRVGCVITGPEGRTLARGFTQAAGEAHAEVMALRQAQQLGLPLRGATVYVTLEPCSHHGRTPPCADALVAAGVGRVVVAVQDPNPLVSGAGIAALRAAGIHVDVGLLEAAARELNIGFFSRMRRQRPWVRLKVAASLDGRTALPNGTSQWITAGPARTDGHAWRRRAGAVLTGIGTVRHDDPRLDVRLVPTARQPVRVLVDSRLEVSPAARLLQPPGPVWIYTTPTARQRPEAPHIEVIALPPHANGQVDLHALLADLAGRGINELHVEAGDSLNGSWLREGLVDELLCYVAPRLLGAGGGVAALGPFARLDDAVALEYVSVEQVGPDLRILARPAGRVQF